MSEKTCSECTLFQQQRRDEERRRSEMQRAEERRRVEEHNKVREQDVTKTYCSFANLFTVFINIVTHVNIAVSHVQKGGV